MEVYGKVRKLVTQEFRLNRIITDRMIWKKVMITIILISRVLKGLRSQWKVRKTSWLKQWHVKNGRAHHYLSTRRASLSFLVQGKTSLRCNIATCEIQVFILPEAL